MSLFFWHSHPVLAGGSKSILLIRTRARNNGYLKIFVENHEVLRTGSLDEQSNYAFGEKRKTAQESAQKNEGSILRGLPVSLTVPPNQLRVFGKTPLNVFSTIFGLRRFKLLKKFEPKLKTGMGFCAKHKKKAIAQTRTIV